MGLFCHSPFGKELSVEAMQVCHLQRIDCKAEIISSRGISSRPCLEDVGQPSHFLFRLGFASACSKTAAYSKIPPERILVVCFDLSPDSPCVERQKGERQCCSKQDPPVPGDNHMVRPPGACFCIDERSGEEVGDHGRRQVNQG